MHDTPTETPPPEFSEALESLWHHCAELVAREVGYEEYVANLARLHPLLWADALVWPQALFIARSLWRHIPHPSLNYALASLPDPERNAPCPCGSGVKYKQCCLQFDREMPDQGINFLPLLLKQLPSKRWAELAKSRIQIDMVVHTAHELLEQHAENEACTLLEPWFADDVNFNAKQEDLLDCLLDVYTRLGRPRKKQRLLDHALAAGDRRIRSAALQRQTTMLSDQGDYDGAWKLFGKAQREDPESPSLSHLEVILLQSEGRHEEARARARFWAHRLSARRDSNLAELIKFMREIAEHGEIALTNTFLDKSPEFRELEQLLKSAPPVECLYTLESQDDSAGPLIPKPALIKALHLWDKRVGTLQHSLLLESGLNADSLSAGLRLLKEQPLLWNAFEVLDTLCWILKGDDAIALFAQSVARPVLDRAESLLHEVLNANHANGKTLEWGWLENRPALHLLGERIALDMNKPVNNAQTARLEWLVLTLNPNDNQGFRSVLMRAYLEIGHIEKALALAKRYPDDFADMQYTYALALFAAGKRGPADTALRRAVNSYPKLREWLLKISPKPPQPDKWGIAVGGNEEAWQYRCDTLSLWQKFDALDWLRTSTKRKPAQRRP